MQIRGKLQPWLQRAQFHDDSGMSRTIIDHIARNRCELDITDENQRFYSNQSPNPSITCYRSDIPFSILSYLMAIVTSWRRRLPGFVAKRGKSEARLGFPKKLRREIARNDRSARINRYIVTKWEIKRDRWKSSILKPTRNEIGAITSTPIFSNGLIIFKRCTSARARFAGGHSRAISFSIIPSDCKSPRHYRYRKAGSLINHAPENPVFLRRQVEIADEIFMRALNSWFCAFLNDAFVKRTRMAENSPMRAHLRFYFHIHSFISIRLVQLDFDAAISQYHPLSVSLVRVPVKIFAAMNSNRTERTDIPRAE